MAAMTVTTVLVPGAWMGGWIWEPTVGRLRERGLRAETLTLPGLHDDESDEDRASVGLEDHVDWLVDHVTTQIEGPVVLVSHSYSGMVTASAADRLAGRVGGLIHLGAFLPTDGRSMLDDWGDSREEREQERIDIAEAGTLWHAPDRELLGAFASDLEAADADMLAKRFTPHPGKTITDRARLAAPLSTQPTTYVAFTSEGDFDDAWADAPPAARAAEGWRRAHLVSGHWPMLSRLDATVNLLADEVAHHAAATS